MNLISWIGLTALPTGHQARGWDIKRWRYRLFATAGKLITRARRDQLLISHKVPEAAMITALLAQFKELKDRLRPHVPALA